MALAQAASAPYARRIKDLSGATFISAWPVRVAQAQEASAPYARRIKDLSGVTFIAA